MKVVMFIFDILFAIAWAVLGVMALFGHVMPPITISCGFLLASLYNVREAIDHWNEWHN